MLSHIDDNNNPTMVDVGYKEITKRTAKAKATIILNQELINMFDGNDIKSKKGPVFQTAIIAGIMAVKKTYELIPMCHPIGLDNCRINVNLDKENMIANIECFVSVHAKTGIEMEALTGVSIAALTIYDMCKAISHDLIIKEIKLIEKTGGKSDFKRE
ncbi:MAG: cyclic pyranopterin monophosphate synthase accessory protein [Candidatus Sericytochromatia bacterium]|nr:MAG: cyclic pyranopterin monophosphate synthase accessory protein [Candidatus Sericytochromatia bacterium]